MKLKPKDFIVVIRELDIGSNKLIGLPHPIVFIPLGQVVPDLSLEAPRYLRVALGYSFEPGNTKQKQLTEALETSGCLHIDDSNTAGLDHVSEREDAQRNL